MSGRTNAADTLSGMGHFTFSGMYLSILPLFNLVSSMFELSKITGPFWAFAAIGVSVAYDLLIKSVVYTLW